MDELSMDQGEAHAGYVSMQQKEFIEMGLKDATTNEWVWVCNIPGVSSTMALKLAEHGFVHAYQVVGLHMSMSLDTEALKHYLYHTVGVDRPDLHMLTVNTLNMWCERYL